MSPPHAGEVGPVVLGIHHRRQYKEIMAKIADLLDILANPSRITQIIRE